MAAMNSLPFSYKGRNSQYSMFSAIFLYYIHHWYIGTWNSIYSTFKNVCLLLLLLIFNFLLHFFKVLLLGAAC
jgi:hypothetical protein